MAAIGLRYKFGTGPKSTGPDLEKNENRLYNENVNWLKQIEFHVEAGLAPEWIRETILAGNSESATQGTRRAE